MSNPATNLKRNFISMLALILLTSNPLGAFAAVNSQDSTGTASNNDKLEAFRKNPPNLPPPRPFQLPKVTNFKLANDLDVYMVENHKVPYITALLGFKTGKVSDPSEKLGLAELTSDMLTEGAGKLNSKELASQIDFIGGSIYSQAGPDFTLVNAQSLSKYTPKLFSLLSSVVIDPSFPEDELALKKTNIIQELELKRAEPSFLAKERFNKVLYGNHPYANVAPKPETIKRISKLDLETFHKKNYLPNNATLVVVGDFDPAKMKEILKENFEKPWPKAPHTAKHDIAVNSPKHNKEIFLIDRAGSVQSNIYLGNIGIKRNDKDYFPFIVANEILGGSSRSRLFLNIREQKGYTYGAYSRLNTNKMAGDFVCTAEVRNNVTGPSLEEFLYELDKIRNVAVSPKELKEAQNHLAGTYQLSVESQLGLASRLIDAKLNELPVDYLTTYANNIMQVTPAQIQEVMRKYINLNSIDIVVVGDKNQILNQLEPFAPVVVFDTNGNPQTGHNQVAGVTVKPKTSTTAKKTVSNQTTKNSEKK